ncbi:hypothetical protein P3X46_014408 [Hevea brasiliensis]|uniref:Isopenicillin N synthase-like Fe(2+) 2OG dioxygenase domain-containing protein n=1 Tax=Hevea brasiliensis TaxID=3981 RepID=A0ABQ9M7S8_HEVBR|nr:gibberellin 2-beta-dioxygenase 2 [Hevea brasiliensis]KAJ9175908.1 hypothetical protein P3X46_014408 [Hevea brasiliensis]
MASSAQKQHQHLPKIYSTTSAPPPTPSSHTHHVTSAADADALSRLLHRLPPTLSLPTRRSTPATSPPVVSLSDPNSSDLLLSASSQLGFFQVTDHDIPSQIAKSSESESLSLFQLTRDKKESYFPENWPLGFEDDEDGKSESFWLDANCSPGSTELKLSSLHELTRALEKVGLEIIEMLSREVGFENPLKEDPTRICSLMLVHEGSYEDKPAISGGFYPYIVGLQYQIRSHKYSLLADSGWVAVQPQADSVMVTVGDIAQVWSNGRLKKVRGRPLACMGEGKNSSSISMTLLVTLPTESTVSPLLPKPIINEENANNESEVAEEVEEASHGIGSNSKEEGRLFSSFSFEDYAWRVYHEPLLLKDPLDKYRIIN